uniref:S-layer homology domain-containing protein n=1 Tax=Paenibacillus koleovorans TaxID=121608 RepID=UPI00157FC66E
LKAVDEGTEKYREIYWRFYVKNGPTWTVSGAQKLSRATIMASADWKQAMIGHIWSAAPDNNYLSQDPASGTDTAGVLKTTQYNDFNNLRWLGKLQGNVPFFATDMRDKWQAVEAHIKLNDAGQSNGVFEFWVDDVLQARQTDMNWVGSYSEYGINAIFIENFNNTAPAASMTRVIDNFVVSTQKIGLTAARQTPTVTTTASVSEAVYGSAVTLQTVVAGSGAPAPTGTVTFLDGGQPIGSPVTLVNGTATLTTTNLAIGQHNITSSYSGDALYDPAVDETQKSVLIKPQPQTPVQPPEQPSNNTAPSQPGSPEIAKTRITVEGQKGDSVAINERLAEQLISQQTTSGSGAMRLVIDERGTDGLAEFLRVELSKEAVSKLGSTSSPLAIETSNVTITLSQQTLSSLRADASDVWFRIVPERAVEEDATKKRVIASTEMQVFAEGGVVATLGKPVKIDTNLNNRPTRLEFPISPEELPADPEARAAFLKQLAVFVEHSDGEKAVYRGEVKYDSANRPVGLLIDINKFSTFTMISVTHPPVIWERYIFGYEDGTFRPDASITRAEIAVLIARIGSKQQLVSRLSRTTTPYSDVDIAHWAYKDLDKLAIAGIMDGYPDQTFRPDAPITRAEFAKMIVTLMKPIGGKPTPNGLVDIQSHWAATYIEATQANAWMTGYPDHTFQPDRSLTRAEAVTVLNRLLQRPVGAGGTSAAWTDVPTDHWARADILSASGTFEAPGAR